LQIKTTAGSENYNYNYCTRKTVLILQLIIMVIQLLQPWCTRTLSSMALRVS